MKKAFLTTVKIPVRVVVDVLEGESREDTHLKIAEEAVVTARNYVLDDKDYPFLELVSDEFHEDFELPYGSAPEDRNSSSTLHYLRRTPNFYRYGHIIEGDDYTVSKCLRPVAKKQLADEHRFTYLIAGLPSHSDTMVTLTGATNFITLTEEVGTVFNEISEPFDSLLAASDYLDNAKEDAIFFKLKTKG